MSVHCKHCGAVASYGHELGHKSDCPSVDQYPRRSDQTEDRTRAAYEAYRAGFGDNPCPVPSWEDAAPWIRDLATVAYLQGTLDGSRSD